MATPTPISYAEPVRVLSSHRLPKEVMDMQFHMTQCSIDDFSDEDINQMFLCYKPLTDMMMDLTGTNDTLIPTNVDEFINTVRKAKGWVSSGDINDDEGDDNEDDEDTPVEKWDLEKHFAKYNGSLNDDLVKVLVKEAEERLLKNREVQRQRNVEVLKRNYDISLIYEDLLTANKEKTITEVYDLREKVPIEPVLVPFEARVLNRGNAILSCDILISNRNYKDEYLKYSKKNIDAAKKKSAPAFNPSPSPSPEVIDLVHDDVEVSIVRPNVNDPYARDGHSSSDDDSIEEEPKKDEFDPVVHIKVMEKKFIYDSRLLNTSNTLKHASTPKSIVVSRPPPASTAPSTAGDVALPGLFVPAVRRIPLSSTWIKINQNFTADDNQNKMLEYMPFFGDDDDTNIFEGTTPIYEVTPDLAPFEIMGEAEELCVFQMIEKHKIKDHVMNSKSDDIFIGIGGELLKALHSVLFIEKSEILKAYRDICERIIVRDSQRKYPLTKEKMDRNCEEIWGSSRLLPLLGPGNIVRSYNEAVQSTSIPAPAGDDATGKVYKDNLLGLRTSGDFVEVTSNFTDVFCRRCFIYDCRAHGIKQVMPRACRDPVMLALQTGETIEQYWIRMLGKLNGKKTITKISGSSSSTSMSLYAQGQALASSVSPSNNIATCDYLKKFCPNDAIQDMGRGVVEILGGAGSSALDSPGSGQDNSELLDREIPPPPPTLYRHLATEAVSATEVAVMAKLALIYGAESYARIAELIGTRDAHEVREALTVYYESPEHAEWAAAALPLCRESAPRGNNGENRIRKPQKNKNSAIYFDRLVEGHKARTFYSACSHEGECRPENSSCLCVSNKTYCDKFCACDKDICPQFYQGCACAPGKNTCLTDKCPCHVAHRECDPDLCQGCGASVHPTVRDGVERALSVGSRSMRGEEISLQCVEAVVRSRGSSDSNNKSGLTGNAILDDRERRVPKRVELCANVSTQISRPKRAKVGVSEIHGWGLFLQEPAKKGDFLLEYVGEIISHDETERRGVVYDKRNSSFIFDINSNFTVDSMRVGSNAKYVNHSIDPNCDIKIMYVMGDHRICFFARKSIEKGAELTFNYAYDNQDSGAQKYVPTWHAVSRARTIYAVGSRKVRARESDIDAAGPRKKYRKKVVGREQNQ